MREIKDILNDINNLQIEVTKNRIELRESLYQKTKEFFELDKWKEYKKEFYSWLDSFNLDSYAGENIIEYIKKEIAVFDHPDFDEFHMWDSDASVISHNYRCRYFPKEMIKEYYNFII